MSGQRVVVGISASPAGLQALRYAVDEARRRGAELHAVRAWRGSAGWPGNEVRDWRAELTAETAEAIRAAFTDAFGRVPEDVPVAGWVVEAAVPRALLEYVTCSTDLIVLGASTRRWPLRDRIARTCQHRAPCPVVVVPPPALARFGPTRALTRQLHREMDEYMRVHTGR